MRSHDSQRAGQTAAIRHYSDPRLERFSRLDLLHLELLRCRLRLHHALIDCFGQQDPAPPDRRKLPCSVAAPRADAQPAGLSPNRNCHVVIRGLPAGTLHRHPFDVLICNARLLASEPLGDASLAGICHSALVYRSQHLPTERAPLPVAATLARLPGALDAASLGAFMMLIDPRALPPKKTIRRD